MDCLFCKIIAGEIPSSKVYEDETVFAFKDINPAAPVHILIVPKKHIDSVNGIDKSNSAVIARIFEIIPEIAKQTGISDNGYRVVSNTGEHGGQTVNHLHFHIIGGAKLDLRMC